MANNNNFLVWRANCSSEDAGEWAEEDYPSVGWTLVGCPQSASGWYLKKIYAAPGWGEADRLQQSPATRG